MTNRKFPAILRTRKLIWIAPLVALSILGLLILVLLWQGPGNAPFVYSLF